MTVYYSENKLVSTNDIEYQLGVYKTTPTRSSVGITTVYYYIAVNGTVIMNGSKDIVLTNKRQETEMKISFLLF